MIVNFCDGHHGIDVLLPVTICAFRSWLIWLRIVFFFTERVGACLTGF